MQIAVVGAGVVGMSCAAELAPEFDVVVIHDQSIMSSTSAVATAIWHVYLLDPSDELNLHWSKRTLSRLVMLAADVPEAGVDLVTGVELFREGTAVQPTWADHAIGFRMISNEEISKRYPGRTWGYELSAPVTDMSGYLPWLYARCEQLGARFEKRHVVNLVELAGAFDLVVNCSGLGARTLVDDASLYGVRGQYFIMTPGPRTPTTYIGDDHHPGGMAYLIPRGGEVLIGGTEELTEELAFTLDEHDVRARSTTFCPGALDGAHVQKRVVGLRPCRRGGQVRFGPDDDNMQILHNYGHGGSGFSLSWGCAESVVEWAREREAN